MEEVDEIIDFTWFYSIGITKLLLSEKRIGRMTLNLFLKLYKHYKDTFDLEIRLKNSNMTYEDLKIKQRKSDEWF